MRQRQAYFQVSWGQSFSATDSPIQTIRESKKSAAQNSGMIKLSTEGGKK